MDFFIFDVQQIEKRIGQPIEYKWNTNGAVEVSSFYEKKCFKDGLFFFN